MALKSVRFSPSPPRVWSCAPCALFRSLSPFEVPLHTDLPKITRLKPTSCTSAAAPFSHLGKDKRLNQKLAGGHLNSRREEKEAQEGRKKKKQGEEGVEPKKKRNLRPVGFTLPTFQSNDLTPTMDRGENKLKKKTFIQKAHPVVFHCYKTTGRFKSLSLRVCSPQTAWRHKESKFSLRQDKKI